MTAKDIDRAWKLVGTGRWDRATIVEVIAHLLAEIRALKRGRP